ncbi:MAG TPA: lipopolysaccharide kinase InaA family protein [Candidatus Binataceae bacterium]|nr:lipopolysaccharide kinase InaA family protein [Candidatus Binataceae bacterium]
MNPDAPTVDREGWRLIVAADAPSAEALIAEVLAIVSGKAGCRQIRRSRHATTFRLDALAGDADSCLFVKVLDPPWGLERLKHRLRGTRSNRLAQITESLTAAGYSVPQLMLHGIESGTGREVVVTARVAGEGPLLTLKRIGGSLDTKRAVLRSLGAEIGRLHSTGLIHGDLTPFNVCIALGEPPRFAFIDNERTRRSFGVDVERQRLRNLVQLGHFTLPGITLTDRLRVFRAYEAALDRRRSRRLVRRAARMLRRRMRRDAMVSPGLS